MTAEREGPLSSLAAFVILAGVAYRITFSSMAASFANNGLADLLIFLGLYLVLQRNLRAAARPLVVNLAAGALALFVLIYFLAWRRGYQSPAGALEIMNYAALACLFVSVSGALFRRDDEPKAAAFLVGLVLVVAAGALYQYWELPRMLAQVEGMKPPFSIHNVRIDEKNYADFLTRIQSREIFSTFSTSNVFAGFLALSLPVTISVAVSALAGGGSRGFKVLAAGLCGAVAILEAVLLALTKSKGGLVAAGGGVTLLAVLAAWRLAPRRWFYGGLAVLVAATAVAAVLIIPHAGQFADEAGTSLDIRAGYWRATWRLIQNESPLEGIGPGNFDEYYLKYKAVGEREVKNPHNAFLLVWAEGGLFSLLFLAAFWVLVFVGRRRPPGEPSPIPKLAAIASLPAGALLLAGYTGMQGGLVPGVDLYMVVSILTGACVGAALVWRLWKGGEFFDAGLVRAGLAAGLAGFLISSMADVTASDAGAATAAFFAAAALAPRGKSIALRPGTARAWITAAAALVAVFVFIAAVFVPFSQAETLVDQARSRLAGGDGAAALDLARKAQAADPRSADPYVIMGNAYEAAAGSGTRVAENFRYAEAAYRQALERNCLNRAALEGLLRLYSKAGRTMLAQAIEINLQLLAAYPTSSRYNATVAELYTKAGLYDEALAHYGKALYIDDHIEQHGIKMTAGERRRIEGAIANIERSRNPEQGAP